MSLGVKICPFPLTLHMGLPHALPVIPEWLNFTPFYWPFSRCLGLAGFIGAKDDGSGCDNWSCKLRKARVKMSPPTNRNWLFTGRMPFLLAESVYLNMSINVDYCW